MKNPFKEILSDETLPETIKERVMADIALIRLSIDIADLFVVKLPDVYIDFLQSDANDLDAEDTENEEID